MHHGAISNKLQLSSLRRSSGNAFDGAQGTLRTLFLKGIVGLANSYQPVLVAIL